jgi:molybdenum cofactor guanylyltransferase
MMHHPDLALGILAGGAGRRFGGLDKGWIETDGVPQVVRLLDAFAVQTAQQIISANRTLDRYRALGVDVVSDPRTRDPETAGHDYPGPLTGVVCLLQACSSAFLLTLPVDLERWPQDLPQRLRGVAVAHGAAFAEDEDGVQPLIACYRADLAGKAAAAFAAGERSVRRWHAAIGAEALSFAGFRFGNRNQPTG